MSDAERHAIAVIVRTVVPVLAVMIPVAFVLGWAVSKIPAERPIELENAEPAPPEMTPERYISTLSVPPSRPRSRPSPTRRVRTIDV